MNEYGNDSHGFLQQQATGFNNNPYLQFQQQQLQQQQLQQQQLMQQQMMQQQMQQQQQMAFLNTMNNPYQQQLMPQMTGAPNLGSNNPFSAFAQKPAMTGQPTGLNGSNGFNSNNNSNGLNNGFNSNNSSNNPLGELSFLQNSMTGAPATSQPVSIFVFGSLTTSSRFYPFPSMILTPFFIFIHMLLDCYEGCQPQRRKICSFGYGSVEP